MTTDVGKVLAQSHGAKVGGEANLSAGLQVAALALKHRQNKNQRQRVIIFVGSPIKEEEKELVKLGKKLKKNSVAVVALRCHAAGLVQPHGRRRHGRGERGPRGRLGVCPGNWREPGPHDQRRGHGRRKSRIRHVVNKVRGTDGV